MSRSKTKPRGATSLCDKEMVRTFDYVSLSPEFSSLPKPAQRALLTNGIKTPRDLSKWNLDDVMKLHGIGSSSRPKLLRALEALKRSSA
jgi:hypothetical protein